MQADVEPGAGHPAGQGQPPARELARVVVAKACLGGGADVDPEPGADVAEVDGEQVPGDHEQRGERQADERTAVVGGGDEREHDVEADLDRERPHRRDHAEAEREAPDGHAVDAHGAVDEQRRGLQDRDVGGDRPDPGKAGPEGRQEQQRDHDAEPVGGDQSRGTADREHPSRPEVATAHRRRQEHDEAADDEQDGERPAREDPPHEHAGDRVAGLAQDPAHLDDVKEDDPGDRQRAIGVERPDDGDPACGPGFLARVGRRGHRAGAGARARCPRPSSSRRRRGTRAVAASCARVGGRARAPGRRRRGRRPRARCCRTRSSPGARSSRAGSPPGRP